MRPQWIFGSKLFGHLPRNITRQSTGDVVFGQLVELVIWHRGELLNLQGNRGRLGIALGADRNVFPSGHRQRSGYQGGDSGGEDLISIGSRTSNANDHAGNRDDAIVGAKHSGAQPVKPVAELL